MEVTWCIASVERGRSCTGERREGEGEVSVVLRKGGVCCMGPTLGGGAGLQCAAPTSTPPSHGWTFYTKKDGDVPDPLLSLLPGPLSQCNMVTISLSGEARGRQGPCEGQYERVPGLWRAGRQVLGDKVITTPAL